MYKLWEQVTWGQLFPYVSVFLSVCRCLSVCICLSVFVCLSLFICMSVCLALYLSISLSLSLFLSFSLSLSFFYYFYFFLSSFLLKIGVPTTFGSRQQRLPWKSRKSTQLRTRTHTQFKGPEKIHFVLFAKKSHNHWYIVLNTYRPLWVRVRRTSKDWILGQRVP